jgi:hypothetical protein
MIRGLIFNFLVATAVVACFAVAAEAQGAGTSAVCAVEMKRSKASLSCSRGKITAAADPSVKLQLQASAKSAVTWTDDSECGVEGGTCQLTICGVQGNVPLDLQLVVVNAAGDPKQLWGIVCITGNTRAVIKVRRRFVMAVVHLVLWQRHCITLVHGPMAHQVLRLWILSRDHSVCHIPESCGSSCQVTVCCMRRASTGELWEHGQQLGAHVLAAPEQGMGQQARQHACESDDRKPTEWGTQQPQQQQQLQLVPHKHVLSLSCIYSHAPGRCWGDLQTLASTVCFGVRVQSSPEGSLTH